MGSDGLYMLNPSLPSAFKIPKGAFLSPKGASWSLCLLMSFRHLEAGPLVVVEVEVVVVEVVGPLVVHPPLTGQALARQDAGGLCCLCFICTFLSSSWRSCCHWDRPWKCSACYVSSSETPREQGGGRLQGAHVLQWVVAVTHCVPLLLCWTQAAQLQLRSLYSSSIMLRTGLCSAALTSTRTTLWQWSCTTALCLVLAAPSFSNSPTTPWHQDIPSEEGCEGFVSSPAPLFPGAWSCTVSGSGRR